VPGYREKLDSFASTFTSTVNAQHRQGYDNYSNAVGDFFEPATHAKDLRVSAAIEADANKIAASSSMNGDGENAGIIGEIKDKSIMSGGTATFNEYYASLVGMVGRNVADATNSLDHQTSVMEQLTNSREAASGVSLDEEMMNLIKYQMAYNATGKLVSTVNQIMDTLIQLGK
jgi:flagellar hook-associated protein 1 FlgK